MDEPQDGTSDMQDGEMPDTDLTEPSDETPGDFSANAIEASAMAAYERHSSFVTIMKIALPLGAAVLLMIVLFYSGIFDKRDKLDITFREIASLNNDLRMVSPRINGLDTSGRPYLLTADTATQSKTNPSQIALDNVQADLKLTDGDDWVSLSSTTGLLDTETEQIRLSPKIDVYASTGYEFHGSSGLVDFRKGIFSTDDPVEGQGPAGTLRADSMTADNETRKIIFVGHVKMRLYGEP